MAYANITKMIQCIMSLSYGDKGWQEKFFLPQDSLSDAKLVALRVALFRRNCLPTECQFDWVRLTTVGGTRDGTSVFSSYPVAGLYTVTSPTPEDVNPNLGTDSLRYRLETDVGEFSMRFMGGIPDAKIDADILTTAIATVTTIPADPTTVNAATTAWETLVAQYLFAIKSLTKCFRIQKSGSTLQKQSSDINAIIPRGVEYKSRGRPFGQRRGRAAPR